MSSEWIFFWVSFPFLALMFGSWLGFARLTMARIEKQMKAEGKPRPCPWDGPGGRVVLYAYAIVLPQKLAKRIHVQLIDAPLIRRYALPKDRWLAFVLVISGSTMIFLGFWGSYYLGFY
ncbi:hypothetical protein [Marinimicrobium sp. C2-29]|uniref:hypothetical protein n=1 Tax=Marinimicrobium sp. C2-29 TaxID=3139825 RepID=UPI00313A07DE